MGRYSDVKIYSGQSGYSTSFVVAVDVGAARPVQKRHRMVDRPGVGDVGLVSEIMLLLPGWTPCNLGTSGFRISELSIENSLPDNALESILGGKEMGLSPVVHQATKKKN